MLLRDEASQVPLPSDVISTFALPHRCVSVRNRWSRLPNCLFGRLRSEPFLHEGRAVRREEVEASNHQRIDWAGRCPVIADDAERVDKPKDAFELALSEIQPKQASKPKNGVPFVEERP